MLTWKKERERALKMGYPSPIHADKEATDRDYDLGVSFCMDSYQRIALCAGTHNEKKALAIYAN